MAGRRGDDLDRAGDLPAQGLPRIPLSKRRARAAPFSAFLHVGAKCVGGAYEFFRNAPSDFANFHPAAFYSLAFVLTFELATLFANVRHLLLDAVRVGKLLVA